MSRQPVFYIGMAAPLVEVARMWTARVPACADARALREKLQAFPHREIGAYALSLSEDRAILSFRTELRTNEDRIAEKVQEWSGQPPDQLSPHFSPVNGLDHRRILVELQEQFQDQPVQLVSRVGLTLQQFQQNLSRLKPELVLLNCHGTAEGFLLFEDGRSRADFVPGERLFPLLRPTPRMLFLNACHSEAVLKRAAKRTDLKKASEQADPKESSLAVEQADPEEGSLAGKQADPEEGSLAGKQADPEEGSLAGKQADPEEGSIAEKQADPEEAPIAEKQADPEEMAIVFVDAETPVEVPACVAFQSMFIPALLRGDPAGEAFDAARQYVANDPDLGDFSVNFAETAPSQKFKINDAGRAVRLSIPPAASSESPGEPQNAPAPRRSFGIRRSRERFVGRKREMFLAIDALLPTRAGIHRDPEAGDRRVVALTREGGIGKTALALEVADWCAERDAFPAGIFELSCERLSSDQEFLSRLLTLFGVAPENQRGDLLALLQMALAQVLPSGKSALLFLDNLDDLFGQHVARKTSRKTAEILETALTAAPYLRILATCRWELGLADHEYELEVPPMSEEESRDVFSSHLEDPAHKVEVKEIWKEQDSPIRHLVQMSGRHPQSLRLLARQMGRKGMTLTKLRDEARDDLLKVLADPLSSDDEDDRLKKVEVSYELSYRHLSESGKRLFERLSRLPGGVWCGGFAENYMRWENLLGEDGRSILEKELDYFALVHFAPEMGNGDGGTFEMLPPMVEFAARKYQDGEHGEWEKTWTEFWRQQIAAWNQMISGRLPDEAEVDEEERGAVAERRQRVAKVLFECTEANWLNLFTYAVEEDGSLARELLLYLVSFCELSGQRVLLRSMAQDAVQVLRESGSEENLAPCIGTLGTVQRELGEREEAKTSYLEALQIYGPLAARWPAVFRQNLFIVLRNYTTVAEETPDDKWWQLWKNFQEQARESPNEDVDSAENSTP